MIYTVHSFPATYGDSFIIEYGNDEDHLYRILIDGGTTGTEKHLYTYLKNLPDNKKHFELLVITHVDRDHIEGIKKIMEQDELGFTVDDIWYNGWRHLIQEEEPEAIEHFGPEQGEFVSKEILQKELPWNELFNGLAVAIEDDSVLPEKMIKGMKLTLLSPYRQQLKELISKWVAELKKAGLTAGFGEAEAFEEDEEVEGFGPQIPSTNVKELLKQPFKEDKAQANGSSIAFLASFGGKKVLFVGDTFPSVILKSLRLISESKIKVDMLKLSHHGSKGNTCPELLKKLNCNHFFFSTNGAKFGHPHDVTVARVISIGGEGSTLYFNYYTEFNSPWGKKPIMDKHGYSTIYGAGHLSVDIANL